MSDTNDLTSWLKHTSLTEFLSFKIIEDCVLLCRSVQTLHAYCIEEIDQWMNWFKQLDRSSSAILLNIMEGYGKGRGFFLGHLLIARGEAYETIGSLLIGPNKAICEPIIAQVKEIIVIIDEKVLEQSLSSAAKVGCKAKRTVRG